MLAPPGTSTATAEPPPGNPKLGWFRRIPHGTLDLYDEIAARGRDSSLGNFRFTPLKVAGLSTTHELGLLPDHKKRRATLAFARASSAELLLDAVKDFVGESWILHGAS